MLIAVPLLLTVSAATQMAGVPDTVEVVRDVVYSTAPGADGGVVELKLDAAFPRRSGPDPLPAVVFIHGGAYQWGDKQDGLPFVVGLARGGYFAVTIDYRLAGEAGFPAAVHDSKAAVRFLRAHAGELTIDPDRIGVWGYSAGGHLAALVTTAAGQLEGDLEPAGVSSAVRCGVALAAPVDFLLFGDPAPGSPGAAWLGEDPETYRRHAAEATPLRYVDAGDPPLLIVHGAEDRTVPVEHARLLRDALESAGVAVEILILPGMGHRLQGPRVQLRVARFLDTQLGGDVTAVVRGRLEEPPPDP